MTILLNESGVITIIDESYCTSGGRANIKHGDKAYTQIEIESDNEAGEKGVLISITDNITDVDGHWTPVHLDEKQLDELIVGLSRIQALLK